MAQIRCGILLLCAAVALWALAPPAQAYLDPGTGNALLQGIIGSAAVAIGLVAHYWRRIRNLFTRAGHSTDSSQPEQMRE